MAFTNVDLTNIWTTQLGGDLTLPTPGGTPQTGDLYIAEIIYRDGAALFSVPAGWTVDAHITTGDTTPVGGRPNALMAHIVHTGSAPGLVFTRTGGDIAAGRVMVYRPSTGQAHVVDVQSADSTATSTDINIPAVATATAGDLIHVLAGIGRNGSPEPCSSTDPATGSGTVTDPTSQPTAGSWLNRGNQGGTAGADYGACSFDGVHSSVGSTGTIVVDAASLVTHWAGIAVVYGDGAAPSDTQAPTLSSPTGTQTGPTTADGTVSTDEANGTLFAIVSTSATPPSVAQIQAGNDSTGSAAAFAVGSGAGQAVSATGVQNVSATGLTASTAYFWHYQHQDAAANDSTVVSSAQFTTAASDTTAPILTSPVGTQTGQTTATIGATTDEGNGTLYGVVTVSGTPPSAAQVKLGQDNTGAAATFAGNVAVSSTGAKTINATGLTSATAYFAHLMHEDAATNQSNVISSAQFTTASSDTVPPTFSVPPAVSAITPTGATLSATIDETGDIFAVVVPQAATDPTPAEVVAGQASGGGAPAASASVTNNTVMSSAVTGLTALTAYKAVFVARDTAGNLQTTVTTVNFTTEGTQTSIMKNGAGTLHANEAFTYVWFAAAASLSDMATATRATGSGTSEADGTASVPQASPGIVMISFADGSVYYEAFA